jgi:hypothetical protein
MQVLSSHGGCFRHDGAKRIVQQLPQLRDIDRDPPRIILAEQLCRRLLKLRAIDSRFFDVTRVTERSQSKL